MSAKDVGEGAAIEAAGPETNPFGEEVQTLEQGIDALRIVSATLMTQGHMLGLVLTQALRGDAAAQVRAWRAVPGNRDQARGLVAWFERLMELP